MPGKNSLRNLFSKLVALFVNRTSQPEGLISILQDKSKNFGDRDDAAMYLRGYDDSRAEQALIQVACDLTEDEEIADTAGESLCQVWEKAGKVDVTVIEKMHPAARKFFKTPA